MSDLFTGDDMDRHRRNHPNCPMCAGPKPAASDDLYTDDDVTAAAEPVWVDWCNHPSGCDCKARAIETARRSVAAVSPAIAARALRQAADDAERTREGVLYGTASIAWLRDCADALEADHES